MFSLHDKVAVVTGAGSGIGEAIAKCFALAGAHVYVADLNATSGQRVTREILDQHKGSAEFVPLDIADEAACRALADQLHSVHGRCDILVNNAGIGMVGTLLTTAPADLDRIWSVNVRGTYLMTRAFLPMMIQRRWGSIINMASIAGVIAVRDRFAYSTTKFAVVGITKNVALDHADSQVRCNCISPGRVETPWVAARLKEYPDPRKAYEEMAATQALKRMGKPEEVAAAALYLASDESSFITGSALILDGGWSAGK
jgi:NAD(P)-dependent dehydrogenase (short-subunit alcohol dehydrogenase family)